MWSLGALERCGVAMLERRVWSVDCSMWSVKCRVWLTSNQIFEIAMMRHAMNGPITQTSCIWKVFAHDGQV